MCTRTGAVFLLFLLLGLVLGRPQRSGDEDMYGEEFDEDMISEDYDDYYDLEGVDEGGPSTVGPNGRRLPWYFTSPDNQSPGTNDLTEDDYILGEDYGVDYNEIDYEEENRLREEARLRKYRKEEEERRRKEEEAQRERENQARANQEEEQRRKAEEENARRRVLDDSQRRALEESQRRALEESQRRALEENQRRAQEENQRRQEEDELRNQRLEEETRRIEMIERQKQKQTGQDVEPENTKKDEISNATEGPVGNSFHEDDPYNPRNAGNKLVYLGHRREDNRCPYGFVMDIYGYCRSMFKEQTRDWMWWEHIRRQMMMQQGY